MQEYLTASRETKSSVATTMTDGQLEQVIQAILEGKYSWACLIVLRFSGYNPAHYIPYRTYKRLIKNNPAAQTVDELEERKSMSYARTMATEHFEQILQAILEGKYSWGCVLVLRFTGHNPVHFMPYRTYKRLLKENRRKRPLSLLPPQDKGMTAELQGGRQLSSCRGS